MTRSTLAKGSVDCVGGGALVPLGSRLEEAEGLSTTARPSSMRRKRAVWSFWRPEEQERHLADWKLQLFYF